MNAEIGVLFVCTANICRSPLAEAVFRHKASQAGMSGLDIDSAGTHDFRVGELPDPRAQRAAERRGYAMPDRRARQITRVDLERFDYVLAMDMKNMTALHRLGEPDLWRKPKLLLPYSRVCGDKEIADPYAGDEVQFELTLDMIESSIDGLLVAIRTERG
jgi:protein-tyrosine phosphatase